jgi:hypothetical protein
MSRTGVRLIHSSIVKLDIDMAFVDLDNTLSTHHNRHSFSVISVRGISSVESKSKNLLTFVKIAHKDSILQSGSFRANHGRPYGLYHSIADLRFVRPGRITMGTAHISNDVSREEMKSPSSALSVWRAARPLSAQKARHFPGAHEFSPATLWAERNQCCKDIVTVVLGIKNSPSWEGFN